MVENDEEIFENPIDKKIQSCIHKELKTIKIAVPFIREYAKNIFSDDYIKQIQEKKIITRFDDSNINAFDIPTLRDLLNKGFEIRYYDNRLHLKLYIFDNTAFISSANLTKDGFTNNIELTVKVNQKSVTSCNSIFDQLWGKCKPITTDLLDKNQAKYDELVLQQHNKGHVAMTTDIEKIINYIFSKYQKQKINPDDQDKINLFKKSRENNLKNLENGFNKSIFYHKAKDPNQKDTIYHDLAYNGLAGTGFFDYQFKQAFTSDQFKQAFEFIYSLQKNPETLKNDTELERFCKELFTFKTIPQYKETLPLALAFYFYPQSFVPIYKLDTLYDICRILDINNENKFNDPSFIEKSNGEQLYIYTRFFNHKLPKIPNDDFNFLRSYMLYELLYTFQLYIGNISQNTAFLYPEEWIQNYISDAKKNLDQLKIEVKPFSNSIFTYTTFSRFKRFKVLMDENNQDMIIKTGASYDTECKIKYSEQQNCINYFKDQNWFPLGNNITSPINGGLGEYFQKILKKSPKFASHFVKILVIQNKFDVRWNKELRRIELLVKK